MAPNAGGRETPCLPSRPADRCAGSFSGCAETAKSLRSVTQSVCPAHKAHADPPLGTPSRSAGGPLKACGIGMSCLTRDGLGLADRGSDIRVMLSAGDAADLGRVVSRTGVPAVGQLSQWQQVSLEDARQTRLPGAYLAVGGPPRGVQASGKRFGSLCGLAC